MAPDPSAEPGVPLVGRPPDAVLFRTAQGPVTARRFLQDAHALARTLPDGPHAANLCRDRYGFAVAFAATLLRGQVALLSGDRSAAGLRTLAGYPGAYAIADEAGEDAKGLLPVVRVPVVHAVFPREDAGPDAPANPVLPADRLAAIVFTSGSTGDPAAHRKHWGALATRSLAAGERFMLADAAPGTVVGTVPPHHMYGFETTVLLPLHAAASSWCGPAFFPGDVAAALASVPAPRLLITTPLQARALLGARTALPPLAAAISATAPLDAAVAAEAEAAWGAPMLEIFGATEAGSIASRRTMEGDYWLLYPGVILQDDGNDTIVTAPHAVPVPLADRVESDPDGRFRLLGRRSDMVKLGGRRASLSGLDRILLGLDGVADGAFLVPDDLDRRSTARLLAFVVAPHRSPASILAELRGRVDPVFLPRRVIRVDALPRNELGKLPRQALLALQAGLDAA